MIGQGVSSGITDFFIFVVNKICSFLSEFAQNKTKPDCRTAEDKIKYSYVQSWRHPQESMDFDLSELNGTTCEGSYNNTDRDGKTIFYGELNISEIIKDT